MQTFVCFTAESKKKKKQLLACHFWQEPFPLKKYYEVVSVKAFGGKLTLPSPLILLIKYQYFNLIFECVPTLQ